MALFIFLLVPLLIAFFVLVGVEVYNRYRTLRLDSYVDSDPEATEAIGDDWKGEGEFTRDEDELRNLQLISYNDAEKAFLSFYEDEKKSMKPEPDIDDHYYGDTPEMVRAYNRARVRMSEWLVDKNVRHPSGFQRVDFLAMNPERPIPQPFMNERKRLENLMGDTKLSWGDVYNIVWKEVQRATPGFTQHEDLIRSSLAQQIRDNERKRVTEDFMAKLKDIQKKVEDEQFALNLEKKLLTERVASLIEEVKKKDAQLETLRTPLPLPEKLEVSIHDVAEMCDVKLTPPSAKRKTTELRRKTPKKKSKRKN